MNERDNLPIVRYVIELDDLDRYYGAADRPWAAAAFSVDPDGLNRCVDEAGLGATPWDALRDLADWERNLE